MPIHTVFKLHNGQVLWPEHKALQEVLELKRTTPEFIWQTTWMGNPTDPSGTVFKREWWDGINRFHTDDFPNQVIGRWISLDTATSESEQAAYTAWAVGDLLSDYRLAIVEIDRQRMEFPDLVGHIQGLYNRFQTTDSMLRGIIIEDKSSGIGALQTLKKAGNIANVLQGFNPRVDKPTRWSQAAVWCKLGCVLLPWPDARYPWLYDAEEELFTVPSAAQLDQADAFSQLLIFLEPMLEEGIKARSQT